MRCPSCTGPTQHEAHLDQLRARASCEVCEVEFDGSLDRSIEVTWRVHPELRDLSGVSPLEVLSGYFQPTPLAQLSAAPGASAEAEVGLDHFNAEQTQRDDVIVKVGIHGGPCIAVTLNERLDYFGRTVNLAARVQGLSEGRDVVLSGELMRDARVRELAERSGWSQQSFAAALKGIDEERALIRLLPPSP